MIGQLTLPADYESDAESVFTNDSRGDASFFTSEAESDFDVEKSPSNPDKEKENYSFKSPESPVEKKKAVSEQTDKQINQSIILLINHSRCSVQHTCRRSHHKLDNHQLSRNKKLSVYFWSSYCKFWGK